MSSSHRMVPAPSNPHVQPNTPNGDHTDFARADMPIEVMAFVFPNCPIDQAAAITHIKAQWYRNLQFLREADVELQAGHGSVKDLAFRWGLCRWVQGFVVWMNLGVLRTVFEQPVGYRGTENMTPMERLPVAYGILYDEIYNDLRNALRKASYVDKHIRQLYVPSHNLFYTRGNNGAVTNSVAITTEQKESFLRSRYEIEINEVDIRKDAAQLSGFPFMIGEP